jgi:putative transposase
MIKLIVASFCYHKLNYSNSFPQSAKVDYFVERSYFAALLQSSEKDSANHYESRRGSIIFQCNCKEAKCGKYLFTDLHTYNFFNPRQKQYNSFCIPKSIIQVYSRDNKTQKSVPLAVIGTSDHIHIFVGLKPEKSISDLVRDIKHFSTNFINDKKIMKTKFSWQVGYAAFSYSHSQMDKVIKYIIDQEKHHKAKTFVEEYTEFMKKFDVKYDVKYLFE